MIKNLIFDFGGVLGQFNEEVLISPYVSDSTIKKQISEVVFDRLYWDRLDKGTISHEEIRAGIKSRMPDNLLDVSLKVYDNWIYNLKPVNGMCELVEEISKNDYKLYLLSDISRDFSTEYKNVEWINKLFSYFEGLTFSGVEGLVKPHKETFENLLSKHNLKANECLFIDDRETNVNGAKLCGINGYVFDGDAVKLRQYLSQLLY